MKTPSLRQHIDLYNTSRGWEESLPAGSKACTSCDGFGAHDNDGFTEEQMCGDCDGTGIIEGYVVVDEGGAL